MCVRSKKSVPPRSVETPAEHPPFSRATSQNGSASLLTFATDGRSQGRPLLKHSPTAGRLEPGTNAVGRRGAVVTASTRALDRMTGRRQVRRSRSANPIRRRSPAAARPKLIVPHGILDVDDLAALPKGRAVVLSLTSPRRAPRSGASGDTGRRGRPRSIRVGLRVRARADRSDLPSQSRRPKRPYRCSAEWWRHLRQCCVSRRSGERGDTTAWTQPPGCVCGRAITPTIICRSCSPTSARSASRVADHGDLLPYQDPSPGLFTFGPLDIFR